MMATLAIYWIKNGRIGKGAMMKWLLALLVALAGMGTAQALDTDSCWSRDYTEKHMRRHPHQRVESMTIGISSHHGTHGWGVMLSKTDVAHLFGVGRCTRNGTTFICQPDCDYRGGFRFRIVSRNKAYLDLGRRQGGEGELVLDRNECKKPQNVSRLKAWPDDKRFKLFRVPNSYCEGIWFHDQEWMQQ